MMLACSLDNNIFNISLYEKNATLGRKFLVAGKGGFNLTHSEDLTQFAKNYHPEKFIYPFLKNFSNSDFRNWLISIGIETYVGTSKRVFPVKGVKPIHVLKQIKKKLEVNNVAVFYHHLWQGWDNDELVFLNNGETKKLNADIVVFALGGSSWKLTGSDGEWASFFRKKGVRINAFYPSNCAYQVHWNEPFIKSHQGIALKNCTFTCGNNSRKGEAIITEFGIEGSGIYPLSYNIRRELINNTTCKLLVDFKPDLSQQIIASRLENRGRLTMKDALQKKINLSITQIELLKISTSKEEYNNSQFLSNLIKSYSLNITGFAPIDEAISTVGGISLDEVSDDLELKKLHNHYCLGEMLDWDAPTGGYLLQACFSMGIFLALRLNTKAF